MSDSNLNNNEQSDTAHINPKSSPIEEQPLLQKPQGETQNNVESVNEVNKEDFNDSDNVSSQQPETSKPDSENKIPDEIISENNSKKQQDEYPNAANNQQQYNNNQSPYSPYGQYTNPYSSNQYKQQQYWSYQQYGGQYQQQNQQQSPITEPPKKNIGLRIFLWILGGLIGVFVIGFCGLGVYTTINQQNKLPEVTASQPNENNKNNGGIVSQPQIEGKVPGDGTNKNTTGITIHSKPGGSEINAKQVYKKVVESVVGVETTVSGLQESRSGIIQGTGIVASSDGYILTNAHVVNYSRTNKVKVIFHNNKQYEATVVGYDKTSDIAVLRIKANNLKPAEFGNAGQLEIGDAVIAIGNPGGMGYSSSLTGGYVSALNRPIESHSDNGMTYIQTDAAINPGNSGGPLVNMYGQVVGINSNKIVATGFEGMGFAIPVSRAKTIIDDLIAHGYVSGRSRLGITISTITEIQSQLSGYPRGVMIREISPESDLNKSNVAVGDVITKADGKEIRGMEDLYSVLNKHKAGDTITLTIFKMGSAQNNGTTRDVKTKLLEDKGETQNK